MKEISHFMVNEANASIESNGGLTVRMTYPNNPEEVTTRLPENLDFGISVFENLISSGRFAIANSINPIKPPSAGSVYLLSDNVLVVHRRDIGAPTHKLWHGIYSGYTRIRKDVYSEQGLIETALRESAEECLLVTRDSPQQLVTPSDSAEYVSKSAGILGLDLKSRPVDVELVKPTDTFEAYDKKGKMIFTMKGFIDLTFESQTTLNIIQIRKLSISSDEIFPVDVEGMVRDGKFVHFNRESFVFSLEELKGTSFGDVLESPRVYQSVFENGSVSVYRPTYAYPYPGPDAIKVNSPFVWAPDNLLVKTLDVLGVEGYAGRSRYLELEKYKVKKKRGHLLPYSVLAK